MRVTEVRIKVVNEDLLLAYADVILDGELAIKGIRLINGDPPFVCMPARKRHDRCTCYGKNVLNARYCNWCGAKLDPCRGQTNPRTGKVDYYADDVHPINTEARLKLEDACFDAYDRELAAEGTSYLWEEMESTCS